MKGLLIAILFFSNFFFAPIAFSASCKCDLTGSEANLTGSCLPNPVSSMEECKNKNGYDDGYYKYTNCIFCSGNSCQAGCEDAGLTYIDRECQTDADCTRDLPPSSIGKCLYSKCHVDPVALQYIENTTVGFRQIELKKPKLEIRIPGLTFTDVKSTLDSEGYIHVPYLGEYIAAIYKFAVAISSIIAAIIVVISGFKVVMSAGGDEKGAAIKRIGQAITGLVILWSSYALFYNINPELVQFKAFRVRYIEIPPLEEEEEVTRGVAAAEAEIQTVRGDNLSSEPDVQVANTVLAQLQRAATDLEKQDITLHVTSGLRSKEKQIELIQENCQNPPGSDSCNPKPGKPTTCILKGNDPNNCPHTTGKAVDVWGMKDGKQCIKREKCGSNPDSDACRQDPCQAAVISAMKAAGFCNLSSEAWHFESPQMSTRCL